MDVNSNILTPSMRGMMKYETPIFASLRGLCGFALNSSRPVAGESEAIAMSLEWLADLLIMDASSGRAMAHNLNIRISGTLGVLFKANRDGQISSLRFEMGRLVRDAGIFLSDRVRNTFLAETGESL